MAQNPSVTKNDVAKYMTTAIRGTLIKGGHYDTGALDRSIKVTYDKTGYKISALFYFVILDERYGIMRDVMNDAKLSGMIADELLFDLLLKDL